MVDDGIATSVLFSAYAEVFPSALLSTHLWLPFLCLRRGVSK